MAVLGHGGSVRLRREAPASVELTTADHHIASNGLVVTSQAFWSGDQITLSCDRGLPVATYGDLPACPDGYAIYADGPWPLNPRTLHLQDDNSAFYAADDTRLFYTTAADVGELTTATYFIYRDQLDRISFYPTLAAALRGRVDDRVSLFPCDFGTITMAAAQAGPGDLWSIQGQLSGWTLNLTATEIDTTAIGERFGDAIKSVVTGGGSIDFLVAREDRSAPESTPETDSTTLLRLLLLTEKGCKADCQFWMIDAQRDVLHLLPGDLYYETSMLVTSAAVNTAAPEIIAGTINFVTVGQIALKMGAN